MRDEVIKELREENKFLRLPKIAQRRQRDQQQKVLITRKNPILKMK